MFFTRRILWNCILCLEVLTVKLFSFRIQSIWKFHISLQVLYLLNQIAINFIFIKLQVNLIILNIWLKSTEITLSFRFSTERSSWLTIWFPWIDLLRLIFMIVSQIIILDLSILIILVKYLDAAVCLFSFSSVIVMVPI